ncbi:Tuberous sclerosis 2-like protein [Agyrium rufum]|nr:Tuberous sclerosis 2-like protein [Agyrium rufum]
MLRRPAYSEEHATTRKVAEHPGLRHMSRSRHQHESEGGSAFSKALDATATRLRKPVQSVPGPAGTLLEDVGDISDGSAFSLGSSNTQRLLASISTSRPLPERLLILKALHEYFPSYPPETLRKVWEAIGDLTAGNSNHHAREIGLLVYGSSSLNESLTDQDHNLLIRLVVTPVASTLLGVQVQAVDIVTRSGHNVGSSADVFMSFVTQSLKLHYDAKTQIRKERKERKKSALQAESALHSIDESLDSLRALTSSAVRAQGTAFAQSDVSNLVDQLCSITSNTTSPQDMQVVLRLMLSLSEANMLPKDQSYKCAQLLCSITSVSFTKPNTTASIQADPEPNFGLQELAYANIVQILRNCPTKRSFETLLAIIEDASAQADSRSTRGGLFVLGNLFVHPEAGVTSITYGQLMKAMNTPDLFDVKLQGRVRYQTECLRVIVRIFESHETLRKVHTEDWGPLFQVAVVAAQRIDLARDEPDVRKENKILVEAAARLFQTFIFDVEPSKQNLICDFLELSRATFETSFLDGLLATHIQQSGDDRGGQHEDTLMLRLLSNTRQRSSNRSAMIGKLHISLKDEEQGRIMHFTPILKKMAEVLEPESARGVILAIAEFLYDYARLKASYDEFKAIIPIVVRKVSKGEGDVRSRHEDAVLPPTSEILTTKIVSLFLFFMNTSASKTVVVYNALIGLTNSPELAAPARLTAMKLLTRLRCDKTGALMVLAIPDSLGLAAALCRTEDSAQYAGLTEGAEVNSNVFSPLPSRNGRASGITSPDSTANKGNSRSASGQSRQSRIPIPPLWMYPGGPGLPAEPSSQPSTVLYITPANPDPDQAKETIPVRSWLEATLHVLQQQGDWEVYSYAVVHLPSQLSNFQLCATSLPYIRHLRSVLVDQLLQSRFCEPPMSTGVKKGDVAFCLVQSLIMLLSYANTTFEENEKEHLVKAFVSALGTWDRAAKSCIQALGICCHITPRSMNKVMNAVLLKLSQMITKSHLVVDILEFLACLNRFPEICNNLTETELRTVFAICFTHLELSRDQHKKLRNSATQPGSRQSVVSVESARSGTVDVHTDLPQYIHALAYHVVTFWFLSLRLVDRPKHVGWITSKLTKNVSGQAVMEEQSQVTLDMMHRTAYLDLGETEPRSIFKESDGKVLKKTWLVGLSIVTIETAVGTGKSQITKRQASGTTYSTYVPHTAELPLHHVPATPDVMSATHGPVSRINVFPAHIFLQLSSTIAPTPTPMEPICLPDDDFVSRAITTFDRNDTVDGHKIGVIYVGNNQKTEAEILSNTKGSKAFKSFLKGLGTKVALKGAKFNTQGLDRISDTDGTHTYAWRDRVIEIVYHIPSMMPTNLHDDAPCINKKRHIGNDFVNIIFNESGLSFDFDTFASQLNYVNIIVSPDGLIVPYTGDKPPQSTEQPQMYKVQTLVQQSFPPISPAHSYKMIPTSCLSAFVRQIAINASVFALVWLNREEDQHVSSWRNRLQQIYRLRKRFANASVGGNGDELTPTSSKRDSEVDRRFEGIRGERSYDDGDAWRGAVTMGGLSEEEGVQAGLDFSRWAGDNGSVV